MDKEYIKTKYIQRDYEFALLLIDGKKKVEWPKPDYNDELMRADYLLWWMLNFRPGLMTILSLSYTPKSPFQFLELCRRYSNMCEAEKELTFLYDAKKMYGESPYFLV